MADNDNNREQATRLARTAEMGRLRNAAVDDMIRLHASKEFNDRERAIDALLENQERRAWAVTAVRNVCIYAAAVVSGGWAITAILAYLRDWILSLK